MCINMEWMFCASQGKLHGQAGGGGYIVFSLAPKKLDTDLLYRLGMRLLGGTA